MTAVIAIGIASAVLVALCSIRAGGFWRFAVRFFAIAAAACMALSSWASLMGNASDEFWGKAIEAARELGRQFRRNTRAALAEMGERA